MITGLVQAGRAPAARLTCAHQRRQVIWPILFVLASGAATVGGLQVAQQQSTVGAQGLIDRLVAVEQQVSGIALLPSIVVARDGTWGEISGDFVGASVLLDEVNDELQTLVVDASEARDQPVSEAVEAVANAYRTMHEGYQFLAAYEQAGLGAQQPPPPGTAGEAELAQAVDEARGQAEQGISLLLQALGGFNEGYAVLRDAQDAGEAQSLFQVRFGEVQQAARLEGADARSVLSYPATELLVRLARFEPRFAGEEPERVVTYVCVDRDDYLEDRPTGPVQDLPVPEGDQPDLPIADCPDLDNANQLRVIPAGTQLP